MNVSTESSKCKWSLIFILENIFWSEYIRCVEFVGWHGPGSKEWEMEGGVAVAATAVRYLAARASKTTDYRETSASGSAFVYKMADGPSAGDAATDLGYDNCRIPRERYKRLLESTSSSSTMILSEQETSSIIQVLVPQQQHHQRFDGSEDSCSSSSNSSNSNEQVVVMVKDPSRFTPLSSGDDCEEDNYADDDEDEDSRESSDQTAFDEDESDVISGGLASVNVAPPKATSLTSTSNDSLDEDADGPVVNLVGKVSERILVREKDKTRKMGKGGCIKKKKMEKVITAMECDESREIEKEEEEEEEVATKEKKSSFQGRVTTGRLQGSPFKGQIRSAEDTLVGPCGKKRCADRYDSSESSDR